MVDEAVRTLIIRYTDGTEQIFTFPNQAADPFTLAERVQETLNARHLLLEVEGRLVVIPYENVKALEISPPPEKLPPNVIRSVEFAQ